MPDTGKLHLRIGWDGNRVLGVDVKSTRPHAYRILEGRAPDKAVQLVPMLFSVCGKAQQAEAVAVVSVAQGRDYPQSLERGVVCEAMQEHLWRLLLDWPGLMGLQQEQQQFVRWHGALNDLAAGRGDPADLLRELCQVLLGMAHEEWNQLNSFDKVSGWMKAKQGLLAPILAAIDAKESKLDFVGAVAACAFMPIWTASEAVQKFASHLDHEFSAKPQHEGEPMEAGTLAHYQTSPLLQSVLYQRPARLLARVIARLVDLLDSVEALVQETSTGRIQSVAVSDCRGLSVVRTARGMLLHYARIESERVANYLTVAPTEWNFHPQGALATGLTGLQEKDPEQLMETIRYYILSLDPCVEYEIEIKDVL